MREQMFLVFFSTKDENTTTAIFFSSLSSYVLFHACKFWDNINYDTKINIKLWNLPEANLK